MLPSDLVSEMKSAFKRSQEFLDLELQSNGTKQEQANTNKTTSTQPTQVVVGVDQVEEMIL